MGGGGGGGTLSTPHEVTVGKVKKRLCWKFYEYVLVMTQNGCVVIGATKIPSARWICVKYVYVGHYYAIIVTLILSSMNSSHNHNVIHLIFF